MGFTVAERQRKHREKMRALDLSLVQVWVPKDRIVEIKSIAIRMVEEGDQDREPSQRQLSFAQFGPSTTFLRNFLVAYYTHKNFLLLL
jgi:hypothetical protein